MNDILNLPPIGTLSSVCSQARAQPTHVTKRLMAEDFFSGWGIRTLSSENPAYDPFAYHRGTVWPVENAFIANGLAKTGFYSEALRIVTAQLSVAAIFQHMRLPEVLSGHPRTPQAPTPGLYNFGNLFQAWSCEAILKRKLNMKIKNICSGLAIASIAICMTTIQSAYPATPIVNSSTIQSVLNNPNGYMKKTITLNGKVERVIDSGSFVMSSNNDSNQRILVMTAVPSQNSVKQSAGIAANTSQVLKDNQKVEVTGKLDLLVAKAETDSYNPSKDTASFSEMTTRTPVIIVQPDQIHITNGVVKG